MSSNMLSLRRVKKYYGANKVLDGINLDIKNGEILGIIGPSGSGKTTFLRTIIGYIKPDSGEIIFHDKSKEVDILKNPDWIKKKYGFASQHASFYLKLTVVENLDYFGSLYKLSKEEKTKNINTLLELVELDHARNILAKNLSGGMQRRLDIACSLIHSPDILFLDEPTSDLDHVLAKNIWALVKKINKKGTTIVVASHELAEMETLCSRIGILHHGKFQHLGTIGELKKLIPNEQEIHIQTYPGDYDKIIQYLNEGSILKIENKISSLVIYTKSPQNVLKNLLILFQKQEKLCLILK